MRSLGVVARRLVTALVGLSTGVMFSGGGVAHAASPPAPTVDVVHAILLDWYQGCFMGDAWQTLNTDWSTYGSIPVSITTGGHLCDGTFTLADLEASGADTVILEGTAFWNTLTPDEIQALQTYVEQGHTLLGSDTVFQWKTKHSDNGLAPLFGLAEQSTWYKDGLQGKSPTYQLNEQDPDAGVLLRDVKNPYVSSLHTVLARSRRTRSGSGMSSTAPGTSG